MRSQRDVESRTSPEFRSAPAWFPQRRRKDRASAARCPSRGSSVLAPRTSGCGGRFPPLRVRCWPAENPVRLGERIAEESRCSAKPDDSRISRTACEPGQSGRVMVTLVRSPIARTSSVSAAESVKNPSRITFGGKTRSPARTASAALLRRAWRKPRPRAFRFRSTSSSRPARSAGRAAAGACSNNSASARRKPGNPATAVKRSGRSRSSACSINRSSSAAGAAASGDQSSSQFARVQISRGRTGNPDRASNMADVLHHGGRGNNQERVGLRSKLLQRHTGFSGRRRTRNQEVQVPTIRQDERIVTSC